MDTYNSDRRASASQATGEFLFLPIGADVRDLRSIEISLTATTARWLRRAAPPSIEISLLRNVAAAAAATRPLWCAA